MIQLTEVTISEV